MPDQSGIEAIAMRGPPPPIAQTCLDSRQIVLAVAARHGEGWEGNRKAFINRVWATINDENTRTGDSTEIEFKAMLAEAHRTGHIVLSNADLKSKSNAQDLQESAVTYMNTVWHYVRVVE